MALIDIRHFTTPFKDRITLVIIIALSLAFALYRVSASSPNQSSKNHKPSQDLMTEIEKLLDP